MDPSENRELGRVLGCEMSPVCIVWDPSRRELGTMVVSSPKMEGQGATIRV